MWMLFLTSVDLFGANTEKAYFMYEDNTNLIHQLINWNIRNTMVKLHLTFARVSFF